MAGFADVVGHKAPVFHDSKGALVKARTAQGFASSRVRFPRMDKPSCARNPRLAWMVPRPTGSAREICAKAATVPARPVGPADGGEMGRLDPVLVAGHRPTYGQQDRPHPASEADRWKPDQ